MNGGDLQMRVSLAYQDALTDVCEEMQRIVARGDATEDEVSAAMKAAEPFSDLADFWDEWVSA